jgi:hypothetical protein
MSEVHKMKYEIYTTAITKFESNEEQAKATAIRMSRKYGKATLKVNGERQAIYKRGMKLH